MDAMLGKSLLLLPPALFNRLSRAYTTKIFLHIFPVVRRAYGCMLQYRSILISYSPGRWFVAHLLKLIIAYITVNYDIEPLEKRPLNRIVGNSIVPSHSVTLKVRRINLEQSLDA